MASRPAFLSGQRGSPVKKPDPRLPDKRPERKPDRRTPGRKNPDRPRRKEPLPRKRPRPDKKPRIDPTPDKPPRKKPLFPVKPKPKVRPFSRLPVPLTKVPVQPMKKWLMKRLLKLAAAGLIPPIGLALTLWELYDLYRWYMEYQTPDYGNPVVCTPRDGAMYPFEDFRYLAIVPNCNVGLSAVGNASWSGQPYVTWWQGRNHPFGGQRWVPVETYPLPAEGPIDDDRPLDPKIRPLPLRPELPYPYPLSDDPLPYTPFPLDRPLPEPRNDPDLPNPWEPLPEWPVPDVDVPSIDLTPGEDLTDGKHERRPPEPPEREKKKRLGKSKSDRWLWVLNNIVGTFTEIDDTVSAIYKGLPWKYRRWKGKDGVWRDRDANTALRLERLYKLVGKIDIDVAVDEIIKNEMTDKAFGKVGNRLKKKTRELADDGLWGSFQGLGRNPNRFNKSWEEVYKKLKTDAAKREREKGHNWYYSKSYDRETNRWVGVWKQRPMTQIPWYRQRSNFDRTRHLTGQDTGYKTKVPRYFYSPRDTYGDNADYNLNKWDE